MDESVQCRGNGDILIPRNRRWLGCRKKRTVAAGAPDCTTMWRKSPRGPNHGVLSLFAKRKQANSIFANWLGFASKVGCSGGKARGRTQTVRHECGGHPYTHSHHLHYAVSGPRALAAIPPPQPAMCRTAAFTIHEQLGKVGALPSAGIVVVKELFKDTVVGVAIFQVGIALLAIEDTHSSRSSTLPADLAGPTPAQALRLEGRSVAAS